MKVSNPLTIIAIFSGVAETLATVALVNLPQEIQSIFVYFVMFFPTSIVFLFFWVLYFKNTSLYAPSDFDNQDHYLEVNQLKEKVSQKVDSIFEDLNKNGQRLSQDEISKVKTDLVSTIDTESLSLNTKKILDFLKDGDASTNQVAQHLGISQRACYRMLRRIHEKELVLKTSLNIPNSTKWSIKT